MDLQKDMVVMLLSMLEGSFGLYFQVPIIIIFKHQNVLVYVVIMLQRIKYRH